MPTIDDPTLAFEHERARLVRLAYRMLGSLGEAEDVVQDAWLRWRQSTMLVWRRLVPSCRARSLGSAWTS